jgi:hypothetical protein
MFSATPRPTIVLLGAGLKFTRELQAIFAPHDQDHQERSEVHSPSEINPYPIPSVAASNADLASTLTR